MKKPCTPLVALFAYSSSITAAPPPPPVVIVPQPRSTAESYGDWTVSGSRQFIIASTKNETGSAFGMICTTSCFYFLNAQKQCDDGHEYPGLLNADSGSKSITLRCVILKDNPSNINLLAVNEPLDEVIEDSVRLGFAFPMANGSFNVSRFSLSGARQATRRATNLASASAPAKDSDIRDTSL